MRSIWRVVKETRPFRGFLLLLSFLILVAALIDVGSSVIIKFVIDELQAELVKNTGNLQRAYRLLVVMLGMSIAAIATEAFSSRLGDYTSGRIGRFLTNRFYQKIFTLPQEYFDSQISGKIVNQLSRGILSLKDFLGVMSNFIVPALIQSVFAIGVLAYFNPLVALLGLLTFPMYVAISHYSTKRWGEFQVKRNKIEDITRGRIQEVISNIKLVKSYGAQEKEWHSVSDKLGQSLAIYDQQSAGYHFLNFLRNLGLEVALVAVAFIVIRQAFVGAMSFGELVLVVQLFNRLRRPLFAMSFILERIKQAETGSKEYFEILDLPSAEEFVAPVKKQKTSVLLPCRALRLKTYPFAIGREAM